MKYLSLLILLTLSVTIWGASEADKEAASKKLDSISEEAFDAETDEEALQKLKKKAADKRKESDDKKLKEAKEEQVIQKEPIQKEEALKDTVVNETQGSQDTQEPRTNKQQTFENENKEEVNGKMMITLGGGYSGWFDYHPSEHYGLEVFGYIFKENSHFGAGAGFGAGVVTLDDYNKEPYLSFSITSMFTFINPNWGPFLRADLGIMAWWEPADEDDQAVIESDDEEDEDLNIAMIGIILKAGGGFLIGSDNGGVNIHLLYTVHATTSGLNNGVELQLGFHF